LKKNKALKNKSLIKGGVIRGRSPQAKLWVRKADRLNHRVGGLIDYEFLDKTNLYYKIFACF